MQLTIDQALQKAVEAHKAGQIQEADRLYTAILKAQPKHPDANHNLGVLAVSVGKANEALPFLKTALEANPSIEQFWISYIDAFMRLEKLEDAEAALEQAKYHGLKSEAIREVEERLFRTVKNTIPVANHRHKRAIELRDSGNYTDAIELLAADAKFINTNVITLCLLAHCYILNDELEAASLTLNKAKEFDSQIALIGWNEARLLLKEKRIKEALSVARLTHQRYPNDVEGFGVLGACLRVNGKLDESMVILDRAILSDPNFAEALMHRGLIKLALEDKLEALLDLEAAYQLKPHLSQIGDLILSILYELKDAGRAIPLLNKKIKLNPNDENLHVNLALCYHELGYFDDAISAYYNAIKIRPDFAEAYNNLGVTLREKNCIENAVEAYKNAIAIRADFAEAHNNLGVCLREQGNLIEAMRAHQNAISVKVDFPEAYNNLSAIFEELGEIESSITALTDAFSVQPDFPETLVNLSNLNSQLLGLGFVNEELSKNIWKCVNRQIGIPKLEIFQAITALLQADQKAVLRHLKNYSDCAPTKLSKLKNKDQIFCAAYHIFLSKLTMTQFKYKTQKTDIGSVYHLGESHCLSYAHQRVKIGNKNYIIQPKITYGAKAYHFTTQNNNAFKAITKLNFESLNKASIVFLSFGEIDCRPNEGFNKAAKKLDVAVTELIETTVKEYISWFLRLNQVLDHRLIFFNVPAPVYDPSISHELNAEVAKNIQSYNSALEKYSLQFNFETVDVHGFSMGENGFSNLSYHIDDHHLGSEAIALFEQQLN